MFDFTFVTLFHPGCLDLLQKDVTAPAAFRALMQIANFSVRNVRSRCTQVAMRLRAQGGNGEAMRKLAIKRLYIVCYIFILTASSSLRNENQIGMCQKWNPNDVTAARELRGILPPVHVNLVKD